VVVAVIDPSRPHRVAACARVVVIDGLRCFQAGQGQVAVGDVADGGVLVGGLDQAEVVDPGRLGRWAGGLGDGGVGVMADHQGGGHSGGGALHEHGEAGQVLGVVAHLDAPADQGGVDLVAVAGQRDRGGLGDHPDR